MLGFLKSLFVGRPSPPAVSPTLEALLEPDSPWSEDRSREVVSALRRVSEADSERVEELLEKWYAEHPIVVVWRADYDHVVNDPLRVEISDAATFSGMPFA